METIEFNDFQEKTLAIPEELDAFLGGGRGGGKSYALALLAMRHVEMYGNQARILYLRKTYKGMADFELITRELFGMVYGTAARYNQGEHVWKFPNGAYMELGQLETQADYAKYQGRSFTLLIVDEAGQYPTPDLLDIMRSNLRGPAD
ncbi:MAG TPA: terminase, partial [Alcanivorax sp.]|nr:terminase [Alcanivorax sp.]